METTNYESFTKEKIYLGVIQMFIIIIGLYDTKEPQNYNMTNTSLVSQELICPIP